MSLASPPGRLRCTGRRRRPIRIGSWAFTRTWVGVERWCPQQRPQGGKRRQKAASPLPASQGGQGFPRTPICSTRTHRRWIRQDPNRTGDWEGMHGREGGNTSRSGTPAARRPHGRTLRHAARHASRGRRPGSDGLREEEAPKTPPPPSPAAARAFPAVVSGGGEGGGGGGGRRRGKTLDSPESP